MCSMSLPPKCTASQMTPEVYAEVRRMVHLRTIGFKTELETDDIANEIIVQWLEKDLATYPYSFGSFVWMHARWIPIHHIRHHKSRNFSSLYKRSLEDKTLADFEDNIASVNDPQPRESCTALAQAILDAIQSKNKYGEKFWTKRPKTIASDLVRTLAESADSDSGLGVDEYDQTRERRGDTHSAYCNRVPLTRPARSAIYKRIGEKYGFSKGTAITYIDHIKNVVKEIA